MKKYNVLVIAANPFSDINNNGKTLKSIFSTFDKDKLFELYFRPQDNIIGDGDYASSYYAIGEMDILRSFLHCSKKCGGIQVFEPSQDKAVAEDKTYRSFLNGRLKNVKWLRKLLWNTRKWDTEEYRKWVADSKPDIVFALLGGPGIMFTIAQEIAENQNIPLAVYFTDDYLLHWPKKSFIDRWRNKKDTMTFKQIVEKSALRFCIGEKMCEEYSAYFGKDFYPIMNCAEIKPYNKVDTGNEKPVISYFGSLWLDRWKMISRLSDLVGDKGVINVYSGNELSEAMREAFNKPNIHFNEPVTGEKYEEAVRNSDVLLHVESDDITNREKTALSISTKIPDCLASGKPLMAYGPTEVASIRLLSDYFIGFVVDSEADIDQDREAIVNFLNNPSIREGYSERGYQFAVERFDKNKISREVFNKLHEAILKYQIK